MKRAAAEILREYGPFPGAEKVHGLTFEEPACGLRPTTG